MGELDATARRQVGRCTGGGGGGGGRLLHLQVYLLNFTKAAHGETFRNNYFIEQIIITRKFSGFSLAPNLLHTLTKALTVSFKTYKI